MYRNQSWNASRIFAKAAILSTSPLFPVRMTSRVRATRLEYTMEHPASSRRVATVHRTVAFSWVRARRPDTKKESPEGLSFLVRATGLEPARLSQRNLNPPSLPIPPRPRIACNRVILSWEPGNVNGRQPEPLKFQAKADPCPNKFLKVSALSGKMTVYKDSHRQEMAKAHGTGRAF